MPYAMNEGLTIHYEVFGAGDPVILITGLGGVGASWGEQIDRFAADFETIVPDHRGTGTSAAPDPASVAYTMDALAGDMAAVVRHAGGGPAHIVGSSTGGAFAQLLALDHPDVVRSITLASSWAKADDHFRHQFAARRQILQSAGPGAYTETTALFLYSPGFMRDHYAKVREWCDRAGGATDPKIMSARIDMIVAHDTAGRLHEIDVPTLVVVGREDTCTPPVLSQELADGIPGASYVEMAGGHIIYKENPDTFHQIVTDFIKRV